jgi:hypothetical protein
MDYENIKTDLEIKYYDIIYKNDNVIILDIALDQQLQCIGVIDFNTILLSNDATIEFSDYKDFHVFTAIAHKDVIKITLVHSKLYNHG